MHTRTHARLKSCVGPRHTRVVLVRRRDFASLVEGCIATFGHAVQPNIAERAALLLLTHLVAPVIVGPVLLAALVFLGVLRPISPW